MDFLLQKNNGNFKPLKIELNKNETLVDSTYIADLRDYAKVSEKHASICYFNGSWYIEDIGSEYGIFVNSFRVSNNPRKLEYYDIIGLGASSFLEGAFICVLCPVTIDTEKRQNLKIRTFVRDSVPVSSSTNSEDIHTSKLYLLQKNIKESFVPLIKCDSKSFIWPSDVNIINFTLGKSFNISQLNIKVPCTSSLNSEAASSTQNDPSNSSDFLDFDSIDRSLSFVKEKHSCLDNSSYLKSPVTHLYSLRLESDDSDTQSKSSVESMDRIVFPSRSVLSQIDKSKTVITCDKKTKVKSKKFSKKFNLSSNKKHAHLTKNIYKKPCHKTKLASKTVKESVIKQSHDNLDCGLIRKETSTIKQSNAYSRNCPEFFQRACDSSAKDDKFINSCEKILCISEKEQSSNAADKNVNANKFKKVHSKVSKRISTVKTRPDTYGSRTTNLLNDMEIQIKPKSKHANVHFKKLNASINSRESSKQTDFHTESCKKLHHTSKYISKKTSIIQPSLLITSQLHSQESVNLLAQEKINLPAQKSVNNMPMIKISQNKVISTCLNEHATKNLDLESSISTVHITKSISSSLISKTSDFDVIQMHNNMECLNQTKQHIKMLNQKFSNSYRYNAYDTYKDKKLLKGYDYIELIRRVVEINTKWLNEKEDCVDPPTDIAKEAENIPLKFDSYRSYSSLFFSMIMLEIWEDVYFQSKPIFKNKVTNKFYFSVVSYVQKGGLVKLECESVVNEKVSFIPSKENLVILELKQAARMSSSIFGFITKHMIFHFNIDFASAKEWRSLPHEWLKNSKLYKFDVYIKNRNINILKDCLMEGNGICSLSYNLQLLDSLSYLENSPFLDDILNPNWDTFSVECSDITAISNLFSLQETVSKAVCNAIKLPENEKKIILLQGPPGSGKTSIILRILNNLIYQNKLPMKILISTHSNYAIDKIGNQLIKQNAVSEWRERPLNFVRLGHPKVMHPNLMPYAFTKKVERCRLNSEKECRQWEDKLNNINSELSYCEKAGNEMYNERLRELRCRSFKVEAVLSKKRRQLNEISHKKKVLSDAHVILSTLKDCMQLHKFKNDLNICCCIIDEVNQATELDFLLSLKLQINKFFLIGDPMQLPATVKSQLAIKYGFQRSIIERFHLHFISRYKKSPLIHFSKQFRMNASLWDFPLRFFYNKNIVSSEVDWKTWNFPLRPYILLDDQSELQTFPCTHNGHSGPSTIVSVCSSILELYKTNSIGVIVPFQETKDLYASAIIKNVSHSNVEVGTVCRFQGREKEIIIISCFRDDVYDTQSFFTCCRQLNVALTRATRSLIICGPLSRLQSQSDWKNLIFDAQQRRLYFAYNCTDNISLIFKNNMAKKQ